MLRFTSTRTYNLFHINRIPEVQKLLTFGNRFYRKSGIINYDDDDHGNFTSYDEKPNYYDKFKPKYGYSNRSTNTSFQQRSKFDNRNSFDNRNQNSFSNQYIPWENKRFQKELIPASFVEDEMLPIEKNFYVEHEHVTQRSEEEVEQYRENLNISVTGSEVAKPITDFDEFCLPVDLKNVVLQQGYSKPTPIQAQGWPIALSGKNMVGISQTGSGKTLVFMLPAIIHALNQPELKIKNDERMPQILVLAPTRELVQQILAVSSKFCGVCRLKIASAYGGASKNYQLQSLTGAHICIATPGRLIDFISGGLVSLEKCTYLVLDEADRMLDMGFEPQIRSILGQIRPDRQTLMWSATWPREIRYLAEEFLQDYVKVTIGSGQLAANPQIEQNIYIVEELEKEDKLESLLNKIVSNKQDKVLVFAQTKRTVDYLGRHLNNMGLRAVVIHGDVSQSRRDQVLNYFRKQKSSILIATDVAARGLDIADIQHVINYDFPMNIEDYIHRIGRTARGISTGVAHSFFTLENAGLASELITVLTQAKQSINPELYELVEKKNRNIGRHMPQHRNRPMKYSYQQRFEGVY